MKLLLDTHLPLWAARMPGRLSKAAKKLIDDPDNALHFSAASIWEIAIKRSLVAQSMVEGALLLTSDAQVAHYEGSVKLV